MNVFVDITSNRTSASEESSMNGKIALEPHTWLSPVGHQNVFRRMLFGIIASRIVDIEMVCGRINLCNRMLCTCVKGRCRLLFWCRIDICMPTINDALISLVNMLYYAMELCRLYELISIVSIASHFVLYKLSAVQVNTWYWNIQIATNWNQWYLCIVAIKLTNNHLNIPQKQQQQQFNEI